MPDEPDGTICSLQMLNDERDALLLSRIRDPNAPWFGLALSGGGVRSATYCLGALQRLAAGGLLKHFDYMSSVSGGGYIAASLHWFWTRFPDYGSSGNFPYGIERSTASGAESENLTYLRRHSSYLTPGQGISIWSGGAVLIRTLLLSILVWFPVAVVIMILVVGAAPPASWLQATRFPFLSGLFHASARSWYAWSPELGLCIPNFAMWAFVAIVITIVLFLAFTTLLALASILVPPETTDNLADKQKRAQRCIVIGLGPGGAGFLLAWALSDYGSDYAKDLPYLSASLLVFGGALTGFGLLAVLVAILQSKRKLEFGLHYSLRRGFDLKTTYGAWFLCAFVVIFSLPLASHYAVEFINKQTSLFAVLTASSGIISGLYGHLVQAQRAAPRLAFRLAATVLAGIFLYSMLVLAFLSADFILAPGQYGKIWLGYHAQIAFPVLLFFSVTLGVASNLNHLGLHRFYRDRLMEAFMRSRSGAGYSDADRSSLIDFWPMAGDDTRTENPYPLINANAILIHDQSPTMQLRGGDSFVMSPMFVGSSATKWMSTKRHSERYGPLTLASAMAASGAAANANAAYIGSGITRDRLISIVMVLLNVRLGLWLGRPGAKTGTPNYFNAGFKYGVWGSYRKESNFVELTDGGHFDNLGIYELVRRRLDVVVALDSEEDPATAMSALASVCQRVHEDFGVVIDVGNRADNIVPSKEMGYPSGAKFSEKSWFVCEIDYPEPAAVNCSDGRERKGIGPKDGARKGVFLYVKSNMLKELSFPAKGYKAKNPDFPNQSSMDQSFEPTQFEAYRELGFTTIDTIIKSITGDNRGAIQIRNDLSKAI